MKDAQASLAWKEPAEWIDFQAGLLRSAPSRHVVRPMVLVVLLAALTGLALQEKWFLLPVIIGLGVLWVLRGGLILHRMGFDVRQRVQVGEKRITITHCMGFGWIPIKKFTEHSISEWKIGSYVGHALRMRSRRGEIEVQAGIPAGFDIVDLRNRLDQLGLQSTSAEPVRPMPPLLGPTRSKS